MNISSRSCCWKKMYILWHTKFDYSSLPLILRDFDLKKYTTHSFFHHRTKQLIKTFRYSPADVHKVFYTFIVFYICMQQIYQISIPSLSFCWAKKWMKFLACWIYLRTKKSVNCYLMNIGTWYIAIHCSPNKDMFP